MRFYRVHALNISLLGRATLLYAHQQIHTLAKVSFKSFGDPDWYLPLMISSTESGIFLSKIMLHYSFLSYYYFSRVFKLFASVLNVLSGG